MNHYAKGKSIGYKKNLLNRRKVSFFLYKECLEEWMSKNTKPRELNFAKELIIPRLTLKIDSYTLSNQRK